MHQPNYQTCAIKPRIDLSEWDILASLPTALVVLNAQGRVVWLNPLAEAMLGYGLIGVLWLDIIQKAFVPRADDGHEVSLADGRRVHVAISALDSLPGIVITLADITMSRDYEKAKENDKRLVAIGTMTAQLAHQIRTPLSSAILYTEHLHNLTPTDERSHLWLSRLQECHGSIEQQIQDLLLFARGTSIELCKMSMKDWCLQFNRRIQPFIESSSAVLQINNQLLTNVASIHSESLIGAVINLIINALQSEATEIYLTLASTEDLGIQISVEDNGKGMTDEVKAQAFLPFYTTNAKGTGLGLAVVFAVAKAHGGSVHLDSTPQKGTQVSMLLPGNHNTSALLKD
jgi:two-component system sensor histidine kinase FlrB